MLNTGPWNRLPITIQWLKQEYRQEFPICKPPPVHMPIAYGPISSVKKNIAYSQESSIMSQQRLDSVDMDRSREVCDLCENNEVYNY